jgi:hypothetical protein
MGLPAGQALSVLYVLADQWLRERQTLAQLGAEDPAPLDELVGRPAAARAGSSRRDLVQSMGGEVIG